MKQAIFAILMVCLIPFPALGVLAIESPRVINNGTIDWTDDVAVGYTAVGSVDQTGGTVRSSRVLALGYYTGSEGTYRLRGSGHLDSSALVVGLGGQGRFVQTGGQHVCNGVGVVVGMADYPDGTSGGSGIYDLSGGGLETNRLWLGYSAGNTGLFAMSGGQLTITSSYTNPSVTFGSGDGLFVMTGGAAAFTNLTVTGQTVFDLVDGGTITITRSLDFDGGCVNLGRSGVLRISDAITNTLDVQSWIGNRLIADGTIDVTCEMGYITATAIIPEPATILLLAVGGLMFRKR